eukprot:TRINITY_DN10192_c0_g1_i1.p1 TRINITY_DN10192_c0_g1~~TRINITY_DN10192_c0_g1_i1.p1  ORF type:complete len:261 (+),score=48.32 TRINITY_DN10192_c0_g1_i1:56-784(+)
MLQPAAGRGAASPRGGGVSAARGQLLARARRGLDVFQDHQRRHCGALADLPLLQHARFPGELTPEQRALPPAGWGEVLSSYKLVRQRYDCWSPTRFPKRGPSGCGRASAELVADSRTEVCSPVRRRDRPSSSCRSDAGSPTSSTAPRESPDADAGHWGQLLVFGPFGCTIARSSPQPSPGGPKEESTAAEIVRDRERIRQRPLLRHFLPVSESHQRRGGCRGMLPGRQNTLLHSSATLLWTH